MRKLLTTLCLLLAGALCLSGCAVGGRFDTDLPHYDQLGDRAYNNNLFYRNDLTVRGADPQAIYIAEGEQAGYFYLYATSDTIETTGYLSWRSKDLNNWECMGIAYTPEKSSWGISLLWAPEVIYNPADKLYYLYYSAGNYAMSQGQELGNHFRAMGVAVSEQPNGPFRQWTGENADDRTVTEKDMAFDFRLCPDESLRTMEAIDPNPVFDGDDFYIYFSRDILSEIRHGLSVPAGDDRNNSIYVVKMKDMVTPDYSTVTKLTRLGKASLAADAADIPFEGSAINEGPEVIKHNGKYYMAYSTNSYTTKAYCTGIAVADSPMGPFVKSEQPLLYCEGGWDHMSGTGHNSFVQADGQWYIVYHAQINRTMGGIKRAVAFDTVEFAPDDTLGYDRMFVNGPTYSLQPLPGVASGYTNIAGKATVTATGTATGSDVKYLTDRLIKFHENDGVTEYAAGGETTVTLTFASPVTVRAVMVYNSCDYAFAFGKVDEIKFTGSFVFPDGKTREGDMFIRDLGFDADSYINSEDEGYEFMRPGGAAIAEFDEITVSRITITVRAGSELRLSEIAVLGK